MSNDLELASSENEIFPFNFLLNGAEALIILFLPFCFGERKEKSMEQLIINVNERLDTFNQHDIRVVCVTRYSVLFI
jgi:hypothetical protein